MEFKVTRHVAVHEMRVEVKGSPRVDLEGRPYVLDSITLEFHGSVNTAMRIYVKPAGQKHAMIQNVSAFALPEEVRNEIYALVGSLTPEPVKTGE